MSSCPFSIAIEASNILHGGGIVHLSNLLSANSSLRKCSITLLTFKRSVNIDQLPENIHLHLIHPVFRPLPLRIFWQILILPIILRRFSPSILYVPGSIYLGLFRPFVSLHQNLLPFQPRELLRYSVSFQTLRLFLLRLLHSYTYCRSALTIFPSHHSRSIVSKKLPPSLATFVIPHGSESPSSLGLGSNPIKPPDVIRLLYVSTIDVYKHQLHVLKAVYQLRQKLRLDIHIDFIGSSYKPYLKRFMKLKYKLDPLGCWSAYYGEVSHQSLPLHYQNADIAIWASSCEAFGLILLEYMTYNLPIVAPSTGTAHEILQGQYFQYQPDDNPSLASAICKAISQRAYWDRMTANYPNILSNYSWDASAEATYHCLRQSLYPV